MHTKNNDIQAQAVSDKATRKILSYSKQLMTVEMEFKKGGIGAMHQHPHEQITYVISGKVAYQEEGCPVAIMTAGDSYYVKPNAVHGMEALEDSKILDIFTPVREDFLTKQE